MKLRDLTDEQMEHLKLVYEIDFRTWIKQPRHIVKPPTEEQTAQHFFSRGISAILDMEINK